MFSASAFEEAVDVSGCGCYEWDQPGNWFLDLTFIAWKHLDLQSLTRKSPEKSSLCTLLVCAGWDLSLSRFLMQSFH